MKSYYKAFLEREGVKWEVFFTGECGKEPILKLKICWELTGESNRDLD
jgi:hypothetical protein